LVADRAQTDFLGNPTTATGEVLAAVDGFVAGLIGYEERAVEVIRAARDHPGSCLLEVYAGMLWMLAETNRAPEIAATFVTRAEEAAPGANERERMNLDLLRAWARADFDEAFEVALAIVETWPRDLAAMKIGQFLCFNRGRFERMLAIAELGAPAAADVAQLHGMLAFAYEELHRLDEAEACAREALRLKADEPWAQHALAHVMLAQGRIDEGAAFLEGASGGWGGLNSFMLTHLWWHLALFYLSQGRGAGDLVSLWDRQVWGVEKSFAQDQVGAVSLLARLELAGADVGERWSELGVHLAGRAEDAWEPFLSVQYLYGLGRAGREAEADRFAAAKPRLQGIGGSHAQRDLFELIEIDALIRAGRLSQAREALEARRSFDPGGVPLNRSLARVYGGLGLDTLAAAADERVREALARRGAASRSAA
jgi:tetratricopeptide (TPR) repeat protein